MHHIASYKMKLRKLSLLTLIHICSLLLISSQSTDQPPFSCDSSDPLTKSYPFCKTTLPINQRVQDLISRLTLDEKISQLVNSAPAIPRLGIPGYEWWSEALHGVAFVANMSQVSVSMEQFNRPPVFHKSSSLLLLLILIFGTALVRQVL